MAVLQAGNLPTSFWFPLECRTDRLNHAEFFWHTVLCLDFSQITSNNKTARSEGSPFSSGKAEIPGPQSRHKKQPAKWLSCRPAGCSLLLLKFQIVQINGTHRNRIPAIRAVDFLHAFHRFTVNVDFLLAVRADERKEINRLVL